MSPLAESLSRRDRPLRGRLLVALATDEPKVLGDEARMSGD